MPEKKQTIGIISPYYGSRNYGAILQAYALCHSLRGLGYEAEQIRYSWITSSSLPPRPFLDKLKRLTLKKLCKEITVRMLMKPLRERAVATLAFAENKIPNSAVVYTAETIQSCRTYDAYIAGSDQVWNLELYEPVHEPAFFLTFVPDGKKKLAYAASIGHKSLTEAQAARFREYLQSFSAVSVREADSVKLLSPLSPVPVKQLCDPVLLLTRKEWDEACADRLVKKPYVFCYFLGEGSAPRKLAADFAKKRKLSVVSIPHVPVAYHKNDVGFGDKRLYKVSPAEFLSLIRYADYVFTDSFHGTTFSQLFEKEYFVVRNARSNRIYSALELFGCPERFCDADGKETLDYIEHLHPASPERARSVIEALRKRSFEFLEENLACQEPLTRSETPPTASPEK